MNYTISKKIKNIKMSKTLYIESKVQNLKRKNKKIINFSLGEPNFSFSQHIILNIVNEIKNSKNNKYSASDGKIELKKNIIKKIKEQSGHLYDLNQVVITNGAKQALYEICISLINDKDEVILPSPFWNSYPEMIKLAGGKPVEIYSGPENKYEININKLEEKYTKNTKMLLFSSPCNPTGMCYSFNKLKEIFLWAANKKIWIVIDEVYENYIYDDKDKIFCSAANLNNYLNNKLIIVNGISKTYAMTGWRVGWMVGPTIVAKSVAKLQSHLTSNVSNLSQLAALSVMQISTLEILKIRNLFKRKRDLMIKLLSKIQCISIDPIPHGAFYIYLDIRQILNNNFKFNNQFIKSSMKFAKILLNNASVATVPGEVFGKGGFLRLSYSVDEKEIVEGINNIRTFLKKYCIKMRL